jgi:hypothetical protein
MVKVATEYMKVERKSPKTPYLGWGKYAIRKTTTNATSPRLLKYRGCIAGAMSGSSGNLKEIQEKFREVAKKCSSQVV